MPETTLSGHCACGAVRFTLETTPHEVVLCHCETCRRWSGHVWGAVRVGEADLVLGSAEQLTWWASSEHAERGFCARCGSSLFFRRFAADNISVAAGALTAPIGLHLAAQICCNEAGDYYRPDPALTAYDGPHGDSA